MVLHKITVKITEVIFNRKLTHFLVIALICLFLFRTTRKQFFFVFFSLMFIVHLFIVNYLLVMSKDINVTAVNYPRMPQLALRNFSRVPIKTYSHLLAHFEDIKNFYACIFSNFLYPSQ